MTEVKMFDTTVHDGAGAPRPRSPTLQYLSFEVGPLADGGLRLSSAGTFLDEDALEFIGEDIETIRVETIDEAVAAIRHNLTQALKTHNQTEH
jgi:hypothetical protein